MNYDQRTKTELIAELRDLGLRNEQLERDTRERVKELECLYQLSELANRQDASLDEILAGTADMLPTSWRYPDITCARVVLEGREFSTDNFETTRWGQSADIKVREKKAGTIEVFYREAKPELDEGPFLKEERSLLNAVAGRLGYIIKRHRSVNDIQEVNAVLKLSEEKWRSLVENAPNIINIVDRDGVVQFVNHTASGISTDNVIGTSIYEFIHPDDRDTVRSALAKIFKTGKPTIYEVRGGSGEELSWYETQAGPILQDGNTQAVTLLSTDISDRKRASEKISRQKKFLEDILESIDSPFLVLDANDYTVRVANSAAQQFGELTEASKCHEITHGESEPCRTGDHACPLPRVKTTGQPVVVEHVHRSADGSISYHEVRGYPVFNNAGKVEQIIEYMVDVTERRRTEKDLRESEERWRSVVENAPDIIMIVDRDGTIRFINHTVPGLSPDDVVGTNIRDFSTLEGKETIMNSIEKAFQTGEPLDYEVPGTGPHGVMSHYSTRVGPIMDGDEVVTTIHITRDITERKQTEERIRALNQELDHRVQERTAELEATNHELETFAYSVSHDLRAPLRAIDGFSQALLEEYPDKLDTRGKDYLDRVSAAASRMARLIDDLLKLSRVTRANMRRERVDLSAVAREIAEELREASPEREATFAIGAGVEAWGDPPLLRLAIQNLLDNAFKFTGNRSPARIEFGALKQEDQTAYFVRDDGVGFDMAYEDKLFAPFQRLHSRAEFAGTGIGLATVQRIVHRHGGRAWGEGQVDRGAIFYFTLAASQTKR